MEATNNNTVEQPTSRIVDAIRCSVFGAGIIGSLLVYGFLQERIMSRPYTNVDGLSEIFKFSLFLVLMNRLCAVVFAVGMALARGESLLPKVALWKYFAISLSNVAATTCQYEALKWVSFPVQMLGKSFKMMPVMLWGILISQKSYTLRDWLIALAITGGVTEFLMTGPISSPNDKSNSVYGLLLLVGFLGFDGFTSTFQEKLFREENTTKYNQMVYVNLGSAVTSGVSLYLAGQTTAAMNFLTTYPALFWDAATLSAAAVTGQFFIYSQVQEFGALVFAATMNVRQVVSILVSYAHYGHAITMLQILGLVAIFAALFYKSISEMLKGKKPEEKKPLINKFVEESQKPAGP